MKKIFMLVILLALAISLAACTEDRPDERTRLEGGLFYTLSPDGDFYTVTRAESLSEEYTVLAEIDGIPVTAIGNNAFLGNEALKRITLPEGIKSVEAYAFDDCTSLIEISLPSSVELINFNAFSDCESLVEIRFPASLKTVKKGAFKNCASLERVYINSALTEIGNSAFELCQSISEVHIDDLNSWATVKLGDYMSTPMNYAKAVYSQGVPVTELTLTVPKIEDKAFYKFPGLESLVFADGVLDIGISAFSNCTSLKSVVIGDSVRSIDTSAFNNCVGLKYLKIGTGLKSVQGLAFYNCVNIESMDIKDLALWCDIDFYLDDTGSANPLQYADEFCINGVAVGDVLIIPEGVELIRSLAFIRFKGTEVRLPASLKAIEVSTFYDTNVKVLRFMGGMNAWSALYARIESNNFNGVKQVYVHGKD